MYFKSVLSVLSIVKNISLSYELGSKQADGSLLLRFVWWWVCEDTGAISAIERLW